MTPPDLPTRAGRKGLWQGASLVWLVPLAAILVAAWVGWSSYSSRGPLLVLEFEEASGIHEGETELRYRDVTVGMVERVSFTADLSSVVVRIRLDPAVAEFADEDSNFWIVEPRVTTQGVTGLDTVLSGVFIEASWDDVPGGFVQRHLGASTAPLLPVGRDGVSIRLTAAPGTNLVADTPILHKGIEVGRIGEPSLTADGQVAEAEGVIFVPYTRFVTTSTRFWDTSGFTFSLGANGAELDFTSLAALIGGGVEFDTLVSGGEPVDDGAEFAIYPDEASARASLFSENRGPELNVSAVFEENFTGLAVGAPVLLDGVRVGEVANLNGVVDEELYGDSRVRLSTTLAIRPSSLGLEDPSPEAALDFLDERVGEGLRARLATASILTGGLRVDLIQVENPEPEGIDLAAEPFPVIPTSPAELSDVQATAEGVMARINDLKIEELLESATAFLDSATSLAQSEDLRAMPGELNGLFGDVRGIVNSDEVRGLPAQAAALMTELQATVTDLRAVVAKVEDAQAVERVLAAVDAAKAAAEGVGTGVEGVPGLVDRLSAVAEKAEALEIEDLLAELTGASGAARDLLADERTRDLPEVLAGTLRELEAAISELRAGGTVENINATLASARSAAAAIEEAAADLPGIVERLNGLTQQARTTLADYDGDSELNRTARAALRDIQDAARALEQLANTLERKPNSIILGR